MTARALEKRNVPYRGRASRMAAERRVAALSRHLTSSNDIVLKSKLELRDFSAEEVYLFLTRDNVELRAKMLDFLKARSGLCIIQSLVLLPGTRRRCRYAS